MADLVTEAGEELRREKTMALVKKYGPYAGLFIFLIILLTALYSGYKAWEKSANEAQTARLIALLDDPLFPENIAPGQLDLTGGIKALAYMHAAQAYIDNEQTAQALAIYNYVRTDETIPETFRALATLMTARLQLEQDDKAMDADLITALEQISVDSGSPWRFHSRLTKAVILGENKRDYQGAIETLMPVIEEADIPGSLKARARSLRQIYMTRSMTQESSPSQTPATEKDSAS